MQATHLNYNLKPMESEVRRVLAEECRVDLEKPLVLGLSGGPDSTALLEVLQRLNYQLVIAHFDHRLRPDSGDQAIQLKQILKVRGYHLVFGSGDVIQFSLDNHQSIEEAARNLRYGFLFETAREYHAQAVAVGHTSDDQVETILMHLLRGSGAEGMKGMTYNSLPNAWSDRIALIRPLLGVWRAEIAAYVKERQLPTLLDESNQDPRFLRNRLRLELVPLLERLNPGARRHIWQTSSILEAEDSIVDQIIEKAWETTCRIQQQEAIGFDTRLLKAQPKAVQRRLLRKAVKSINQDLSEVGFESIERAIRFLNSPNRRRRIALNNRLQFRLDQDWLWISNITENFDLHDSPQLDVIHELNMTLPCDLKLAGNWRLQAEIIENLQASLEQIHTNKDRWQAWIDLDAIDPLLILRPRKPGERFHPLGMQGHSQKISDYMINNRIPSDARRLWPLLASGEEIIWVPGGSIAEKAAVHAGTKRLLHLRLSQERQINFSDPAL